MSSHMWVAMPLVLNLQSKLEGRGRRVARKEMRPKREIAIDDVSKQGYMTHPMPLTGTTT